MARSMNITDEQFDLAMHDVQGEHPNVFLALVYLFTKVSFGLQVCNGDNDHLRLRVDELEERVRKLETLLTPDD